MNTIHSPSIFNSPAASSWIPVCLPKFNAGGFVNAYISFIRKENNIHFSDATASSSHDDRDSAKLVECTRTEENSRPGARVGLDESGIAFVCINGGGEFDAIRGWCDSVINVCFHLFLQSIAYLSLPEIELPWNINGIGECLPEQPNGILCFCVRYTWSTTLCVQIPDTGANNPTDFRRPLRPTTGKEKVCILPI